MALYEEARRPKTDLPPHLKKGGPQMSSFVRYERHGVEGCAVRSISMPGHEAVVKLFFLYSLDGQRDEKRWHRAELELPAAVYARAAGSLGAMALEQAIVAIGICAACWLLMDEPRTSLQVRAVDAASVSAQQLDFWNQTLRGTLVEFQFLNRLRYHPVVVLAEADGLSKPSIASADWLKPQTDLPATDENDSADKSLVAQPEPEPEPRVSPPSKPSDGVLVPLGGGKDCLTLLELLRDSGAGVQMSSDVVLFHLADRATEWSENWRLAALHRASGVRHCVRALFTPPRQDRAIKLTMPLKRPRKSQRPAGMVVGTPPWAAMVCFVGVLVAAGVDCGYVAVGNERSANEVRVCLSVECGTFLSVECGAFCQGSGVTWCGEEVNHQYDKAHAWEQAAHDYVRRHISMGIYYFSGLMNLWEVQIAQKFCSTAVAARYLHLFLSCNTPVRRTRWCAACSKCCFVHLLLAARLEPCRVCAVFGDDLFESEKLLPIYRVLLGLPDPEDPTRIAMKPLECVGTVQEARHSLLLAADQQAADPSDAANEVVVSIRTHAERQRRPRVLDQLLCEMRAAGVGEKEEVALRHALLDDCNHTNQIPPWLGGRGRCK